MVLKLSEVSLTFFSFVLFRDYRPDQCGNIDNNQQTYNEGILVAAPLTTAENIPN